MKTLEYNQRAMAGFSASDCSVSGRTHLDLFSGIGGFALAAQRTGRQIIGIERDERFCELSARRCAQEMAMGEERANEKLSD